MRHRATSFAYSDAMWAKYGVYMSKRAMFTDPKTNEAPKINLFNVAGDYNPPLPNRGNTVDSLLKLDRAEKASAEDAAAVPAPEEVPF